MNNTTISKRGGARAGAGRKINPAKSLRTGAMTAQRILKQLGEEAELVSLYRNCSDARLRAQIIFKLRDYAYGRPATSEEQEKPTGLTQINVHIRRIGA